VAQQPLLQRAYCPQCRIDHRIGRGKSLAELPGHSPELCRDHASPRESVSDERGQQRAEEGEWPLHHHLHPTTVDVVLA
jgi:hypothetical protein